MSRVAYYPGCSLHGTAKELDSSFVSTAARLGVDRLAPIARRGRLPVQQPRDGPAHGRLIGPRARRRPSSSSMPPVPSCGRMAGPRG